MLGIESKDLLSFGIGLIYSLVSGKVQKKTVSNKNIKNVIPVTNTATTGVGAAVLTNDPILTISAMAGSVVATAVHQAGKRIQKKL